VGLTVSQTARVGRGFLTWPEPYKSIDGIVANRISVARRNPDSLESGRRKRWAASQASGPGSVQGPSANQSQHGDIQIDTGLGPFGVMGQPVHRSFPAWWFSLWHRHSVYGGPVPMGVANTNRLPDQEPIELPLIAIGFPNQPASRPTPT
jgi:hypothetical protein